MTGKIKKIFFAIIATSCFSQAHAGFFDTIRGAAGTFDPIMAMMGSLQNGAKADICREGGVCRKFEGYACQFSKNLVSTCALVCANQPGFLTSKCSQKAQKSFGFIPQTLSYTNGETVVSHLSRQLEKGPMGNNPVSQQYFNSFCNLRGIQIMEPQYMQQMSAACSAYKVAGSQQGALRYGQPMQPQYPMLQQQPQQMPRIMPQQQAQPMQQPQQSMPRVMPQQQMPQAMPPQQMQPMHQPQQMPQAEAPQPMPEPQEEVAQEPMNQDDGQAPAEDTPVSESNQEVAPNPDEQQQGQDEQPQAQDDQSQAQENQGDAEQEPAPEGDEARG